MMHASAAPVPMPEFPVDHGNPAVQYLQSDVPMRSDVTATFSDMSLASTSSSEAAVTLATRLAQRIEHQRRHAASVHAIRSQFAAKLDALNVEEAATIERIRKEFELKRRSLSDQQRDAVLQCGAASEVTADADLAQWEQAILSKEITQFSVDDVQLFCLRLGALYDPTIVASHRVDGAELAACDSEDSVQGTLGIKGLLGALTGLSEISLSVAEVGDCRRVARTSGCKMHCGMTNHACHVAYRRHRKLHV